MLKMTNRIIMYSYICIEERLVILQRPNYSIPGLYNNNDDDSNDDFIINFYLLYTSLRVNKKYILKKHYYSISNFFSSFFLLKTRQTKFLSLNISTF